MDKNWNSKEWLLRFEEAKRCRNTRFERAGVFQSTLAIVREGRYVTENGLEVTLPLNTDSLKENVYCENEITIHKPERIYSGAVDVHLCDCLDFARTLLDEDPTDDVCVLNFASASTPGGGHMVVPVHRKNIFSDVQTTTVSSFSTHQVLIQNQIME